MIRVKPFMIAIGRFMIRHRPKKKIPKPWKISGRSLTPCPSPKGRGVKVNVGCLGKGINPCCCRTAIHGSEIFPPVRDVTWESFLSSFYDCMPLFGVQQ